MARHADREIHVAVKACTGWLFVGRALQRAGALAHLAEPVETSALRGLSTLEAELSEHLGYEVADPDEAGRPRRTSPESQS